MRRLVVFFLVTPLWAGTILNRQIPLGNNEANQLFETQDYEGALAKYLELYEREPDNGALTYNIGNAYAALGNPEKATEFYQKAKKSKHKDARDLSKYNLGSMQLASEQAQEAIKNFTDYLIDHPNDVDAKRNLELALRTQEQQQQQQNQEQQSEDQQSEDQQSEDQQNQEQQDQSQEQQNQDQQGEDQQSQDQSQQDQKQDEVRQDQEERSESQQEQQEQQEAGSEEKQGQEAEKEQEQEMTDAMKEQILEALSDQELQQQQEYRKRKAGRVKRRPKDW